MKAGDQNNKEGQAPRETKISRRQHILQCLARMLEQEPGARITTAALAASVGVSEAALYRHFPSKAKMFEGLIDFIEETVFSLVNQIQARHPGEGQRQAAGIATVLVQFAERNPGMTRVMVGDALVFEHERLQQRMHQFFDKLEATLRQCLRDAMDASGGATPTVDAQVRASLLTAFLVGRLQRFARSGFKKLPSEHLDACLARML